MDTLGNKRNIITIKRGHHADMNLEKFCARYKFATNSLLRHLTIKVNVVDGLVLIFLIEFCSIRTRMLKNSPQGKVKKMKMKLPQFFFAKGDEGSYGSGVLKLPSKRLRQSRIIQIMLKKSSIKIKINEFLLDHI